MDDSPQRKIEFIPMNDPFWGLAPNRQARRDQGHLVRELEEFRPQRTCREKIRKNSPSRWPWSRVRATVCPSLAQQAQGRPDLSIVESNGLKKHCFFNHSRQGSCCIPQIYFACFSVTPCHRYQSPIVVTDKNRVTNLKKAQLCASKNRLIQKRKLRKAQIIEPRRTEKLRDEKPKNREKGDHE